MTSAFDLESELATYAKGDLQDPYPLYEHLRKREKPFFNKELGMWLVLGFEDVENGLSDPRLANDRILGYENALTPENRVKYKALNDHLSHWLGFEDPPVHTQSRGYLKEYISGRLAIRMKPTIERQTDLILRKAKEQGDVDLLRDFAYPLPLAIICELLGIESGQEEEFKILADALGAYPGNVGPILNEVAPPAFEALQQIEKFFDELVAKRMADPKDDLITRLGELNKAGQLPHQELISLLTFVFLAGFGTTLNLIANGLYLLFAHPEEKARLIQEPKMIGTAVEEFLRFESPIQTVARLAREDFDWHGELIKKGDYVGLSAGSANRDENIFPNAHVFDIGREPNRHIAFGRAAHFCLGAPLARVEAQVAISTFLERFPNAEMIEPVQNWLPIINFRHLESLRVNLNS
ncbi:MAG: cytochrome P450 [Actinomycetota bacterium]